MHFATETDLTQLHARNQAVMCRVSHLAEIEGNLCLAGYKGEKRKPNVECFKIRNFDFSLTTVIRTFTQNTLCSMIADRGYDTQYLIIFLMFTND